MRLTVAQALVRFLASQHTERDGLEQRLIAGCFGIFGHGNVAGVGQALLEQPEAMPYYHARNEQGMVHAAAGYARMKNRLSTLACTSSIGPGATNMVTGAALATINRLPVLLLPGDIFATRVASPVLQELEDPTSYDVSVNDAFRPVSRFWDRINRPEQLPSALLAAMRVLTDPAETGAVTLSLPQDVQAEAFDWPEELFERRVWHVRRPVPEPGLVAEAAARLRARAAAADRRRRRRDLRRGDRRAARARGGDRHPGGRDAGRQGLAALRPPAGGRGDRRHGHDRGQRARRARPTWCSASARAGATSRPPRAALFAAPDVRFVNLNVAPVDAYKQAAFAARGRRAGAGSRRSARRSRAGAPTTSTPRRAAELAAEWDATVEARLHARPRAAARAERGARRRSTASAARATSSSAPRAACPATCTSCGARATRRATTSSTATRAWATRSPAASASSWPTPDREVFVMVGDGSYLMMAQEIVTAVPEGVKLTIVLVQNHGFASIGALSESVGSQRFGTRYRYRNAETGASTATCCRSTSPPTRPASARTSCVRRTIAELETALREARGRRRRSVVHVETDPLVAGAELRGVVGRPRRRGRRAGLDARGARGLRAGQAALSDRT